MSVYVHLCQCIAQGSWQQWRPLQPTISCSVRERQDPFDCSMALVNFASSLGLGSQRCCRLAAKRCCPRRAQKQMDSRRLDRWYRPVGLCAKVRWLNSVDDTCWQQLSHGFAWFWTTPIRFRLWTSPCFRHIASHRSVSMSPGASFRRRPVVCGRRRPGSLRSGWWHGTARDFQSWATRMAAVWGGLQRFLFGKGMRKCSEWVEKNEIKNQKKWLFKIEDYVLQTGSRCIWLNFQSYLGYPGVQAKQLYKFYKLTQACLNSSVKHRFPGKHM